ncbi:hypothetical protein Z043_112151 [Scleropages formosus]|uniref:Uncharacterized protein n=1 Tax=Scleropages formosus TaxID=113540 RepID=A0A0P7YMR3_SCLFO|nr:hypothetical protein Z043_112151 [Scleropages formosus]
MRHRRSRSPCPCQLGAGSAEAESRTSRAKEPDRRFFPPQNEPGRAATMVKVSFSSALAQKEPKKEERSEALIADEKVRSASVSRQRPAGPHGDSRTVGSPDFSVHLCGVYGRRVDRSHRTVGLLWTAARFTVRVPLVDVEPKLWSRAGGFKNGGHRGGGGRSGVQG